MTSPKEKGIEVKEAKKKSDRAVKKILCEAPRGIILGVLLDFDAQGPKVIFPGNLSDTAIPATTTVSLDRGDIGSEVALAFENGDPRKPVILGKIIRSEETVEAPTEEEVALPEDQPIDIEADGEKVEVTAEREIVLRCGKASITLTSAGKIILRGTYVSSRSSGINKISGGSIQLN